MNKPITKLVFVSSLLVFTGMTFAHQGHMKVETTPDTIGGVEKTVTETWSIDEDDYYQCCPCSCRRR